MVLFKFCEIGPWIQIYLSHGKSFIEIYQSCLSAFFLIGSEGTALPVGFITDDTCICKKMNRLSVSSHCQGQLLYIIVPCRNGVAKGDIKNRGGPESYTTHTAYTTGNPRTAQSRL